MYLKTPATFVSDQQYLYSMCDILLFYLEKKAGVKCYLAMGMAPNYFLKNEINVKNIFGAILCVV